jgi:hypothetical protein
MSVDMFRVMKVLRSCIVRLKAAIAGAVAEEYTVDHVADGKRWQMFSYSAEKMNSSEAMYMPIPFEPLSYGVDVVRRVVFTVARARELRELAMYGPRTSA